MRGRHAGDWPVSILAFALLFAATARAAAQGGPPLITDDPGTVEPRHWEINVALTAETRPGDRQYETPLVDMNYGYNDRTQLKLEIPWVLVDSPSPAAAGPGNSNFGVKWRFRDADRHGPALSTYPQLIVNNPTSSVRRGIVERGASLFLPIEIQRSVGRFEVNADAGYLFHGAGPDVWSWGLAVGRQASPKLELLGEIHGESTRFERELVANVGFRYDLTHGHTLLFAVGRSIGGTPDAGATLLAYAGMQFAF